MNCEICRCFSFFSTAWHNERFGYFENRCFLAVAGNKGCKWRIDIFSFLNSHEQNVIYIFEWVACEINTHFLFLKKRYENLKSQNKSRSRDTFNRPINNNQSKRFSRSFMLIKGHNCELAISNFLWSFRKRII